LAGRRREVDIVHGILSFLEGSERGVWEIVNENCLSTEMWRRYRARMLEAGLIREGGFGPRGRRIEITERGRKLLAITREYLSILRPPGSP